MTRERHLLLGREDTNLRGVRRILGCENERGLRKVHLASDALHELGGEVLPVEHYRQLVAGQRLVGENVDDADQARAIRHVVVPCASRLPERTAVNLPSATAIVPPRWITTPSHLTRPVSSVMGRTKFVFTSSVV